MSCVDNHPNPDGTGITYRVDIRKYPTPTDGWLDRSKLVNVNRGRSVVLSVAKSADWLGVSRALHATGYYKGYGLTVADRIQNHYPALSRPIAKADEEKPQHIGTVLSARDVATNGDMVSLQCRSHGGKCKGVVAVLSPGSAYPRVAVESRRLLVCAERRSGRKQGRCKPDRLHQRDASVDSHLDPSKSRDQIRVEPQGYRELWVGLWVKQSRSLRT